jgi:putative transposase
MLFSKSKSQGSVRNKRFNLAFGGRMNGLKEVLGIWASDNEGSKFWMQVITELKNRGFRTFYRLRGWTSKAFPKR